MMRMRRGFIRANSGNVAVLAAMALLPVTVAAVGAVDVVRVTSAKVELQDALDAAALGAARIKSHEPADIQAAGTRFFNANLGPNHDFEVTSSNFVLTDEGRVEGRATATVEPMMAGSILGDTFTIAAATDVVKATNNVEVALVLDTTASMAGQRIIDLRAAANELVGIVVQDQQTPYYSKVALVPYAMAVNVGSTYAVSARGTVTSGTSTTPGSQNFKFTNKNGNQKTFPVSTCVTERTVANAYTDAAPTTTLLGRHYHNASSNNPCASSVITPLTSNKTTLQTAIGNLTAAGSTGGHIGVAWGWYMVSPNFGYLWPGAGSKPAAYGTDKLLKVVVLMTDGEYNSVYCKGVIAKDSTTGSGDTNDQINCNAPNGGSYAQAQALCTNMKAAGVIVYTVGFDVVNTQNARDLVNNCATDAEHVYFPSSGTALKKAFKDIAQDISNLRISR